LNKKVLDIVSYRFLPIGSGGQKSIAYFLEYLGQIIPLHVVGTKNNDFSAIANYTFHPVLKTSRLRYVDLTSVFRLYLIIKKEKIETLIIEHPYIGWIGVLLKYITGIRLIIHTHNIEYERFRSLNKWWWKILKKYEIFILKKADKIFCISDDDRNWMIVKMGIGENKCITIPYGIVQNEYPLDKQLCKETVCKRHALDSNKKLLFFNGLLDYAPNKSALWDIINNINPLLMKSPLEYNILIAGKNLPDEFELLKKWNEEHIFYAGFVDDIDEYTKAADIFLNPVNTGGGVKTKMTEALGLGATVIATENGALGVDKSVCGEKLKVVGNDDWEGFVNQIKKATNEEKITPVEFYKKYNWKNIAQKCVENI
jgi:glycosyltransferase involved in cell wall biosynthesis